jgi:F-type H+-transporting ATPase subunit b
MKNIFFAICIALLTCINQAFGSEVGMPQLNPEFWIAQIFWLVLIFSSLYLIIWKIFLPKITYSIENRKSRIVNDLDEAQKLKDKAEKKFDEYNEIIEKSKKEAKKIIEDSKKKLGRDIEEKKQKFNTEIEKELIAAEKEIKDLKKSSISNINSIAVETSAELIKKIINVEINKSSVSAIVNETSKKEMERKYDN